MHLAVSSENYRVSSTLVQLDNVQEFNIGAGQVNETFTTISQDLHFHLGLHFHRFIESKKIKIYITSLNIETADSLGYSEIKPLNPMPKKTGNRFYPKKYTLDMEGIGKISLDTYVWPKNSKNPEYKMNGTAATSQGFYWYRNNRLINQDGWNRLRDTEPHFSLARAAIDLSPDYDAIFGLQVGKYKVEPPKLFLNNVFDKAIAKDKSVLREWVKDAEETYRKKPNDSLPNITFVPAEGFGSKKQIKRYKEIFTSGDEDIIEISCLIENLDEERLFEIDIDNYTITLNNKMIKGLIKEKSMASFKLSLFLLVSDYFSFSTLKKNHIAELNDLNEYLIETI